MRKRSFLDFIATTTVRIRKVWTEYCTVRVNCTANNSDTIATLTFEPGFPLVLFSPVKLLRGILAMMSKKIKRMFRGSTALMLFRRKIQYLKDT